MNKTTYTFQDLEKKAEQEEGIPKAEIDQFKRLFRLTANLSATLMTDAYKHQVAINEAETKAKKEYHTKKFNKVKREWQDEVARLLQLKHIFDVNEISFEDDDPEKCESCGEEYKLGVIHMCGQDDIDLITDQGEE